AALAAVCDGTTVAVLAAAHDQLAYVLEVVAARVDDPLRAAALASAQRHESRSRTWARAGGVAGTADDPRPVAGPLPPQALGTPEEASALVADLLAVLADDYAALIARLEPQD